MLRRIVSRLPRTLLAQRTPWFFPLLTEEGARAASGVVSGCYTRRRICATHWRACAPPRDGIKTGRDESRSLLPGITKMKTSAHVHERNLTWWRAAAMLFTLAVYPAFAAEEFPARPVRMLIPFPAGGPADFVGRLFAQNLSDLWGRQVVADNRPGASGIIGTEIAIRSNPDGYTLLF
jgi:hypothetical protein